MQQCALLGVKTNNKLPSEASRLMRNARVATLVTTLAHAAQAAADVNPTTPAPPATVAYAEHSTAILPAVMPTAPASTAAVPSTTSVVNPMKPPEKALQQESPPSTSSTTPMGVPNKSSSDGGALRTIVDRSMAGLAVFSLPSKAIGAASLVPQHDGTGTVRTKKPDPFRFVGLIDLMRWQGHQHRAGLTIMVDPRADTAVIGMGASVARELGGGMWVQVGAGAAYVAFPVLSPEVMNGMPLPSNETSVPTDVGHGLAWGVFLGIGYSL